MKPPSPQQSISSHPYADILHHPRPLTTTTPLSISQRAAQFAPYATLSGHRNLILATEIASDQSTTRTIIPFDDPTDYPAQLDGSNQIS